MSASVFVAVGLCNRPVPIRKHMYSKYLYARQSPRLARIFTVPRLREIAPELR